MEEQVLFTKEENFSFWKNLFLVAVFFTIAPVTLGVSLFSLLSLKTGAVPKPPAEVANLINLPQSGVQVYASLPNKTPEVSAFVGSSDARGEIVRQYLQRYNSPLTPYANFIVSEADKYGVDFRLTTAIAQQESNLCKVIPPKSYNCWGWGITSVGTLGFSSFEEGIETVTKGLKEGYLSRGYTSVREIMSKYTPQSNGSWARGVTEFMTEME